ncbi:MAG: anhydro-N-acetylmuramic acid kinase [Pseudomonadota bacterium]
MTSSLYIGLMSGTSMDGVDGVLADFANGKIATLGAAHLPFPPALRAELMALQVAGPNEIEREALAANELVEIYASLVQQLAAHAPGALRAVAVHGQTTRHRPELGYTRQTNNPALLAELTGIDVIADFRSRDVAAGGQGAPLVPAFHQAQFGTPGRARVLVNIGGIANISVLHGDGRVDGFDTGPGNVLMDAWISQQLGQPYDADGAWAACGQADPALLTGLLEEAYFSLPAPKSTGRDLFNAAWLARKLAPFPALAPADVQASLVALTARTIAQAIGAACPNADAVYVCGGGAFNGSLMRALHIELGGKTSVASTQALGVAPEHVEALAFAWLGHRFSERQSGNLSTVTGARGPRILGALYPA